MSDCEAFGRMKQLVAEAGDDAYTSWSVLGVDVCRRAWQVLHCMGPLTKLIRFNWTNIAKKAFRLLLFTHCHTVRGYVVKGVSGARSFSPKVIRAWSFFQ